MTIPSSRSWRRRDCLPVLGAGLLSLPAMRQALAQAGPVGTAIGERVSWPEVRLLDGRRLAVAEPGQGASVVVFFSTTCPFCARHNVHVQKLFEASAGLPLRVLGVAHDREPDTVLSYAARRGLRFDITLEQQPLHAALSRMPGIPLTCVVDRQQRLREVIRGEMFEEDVLGLARWARA